MFEIVDMMEPDDKTIIKGVIKTFILSIDIKSFLLRHKTYEYKKNPYQGNRKSAGTYGC